MIIKWREHIPIYSQPILIAVVVINHFISLILAIQLIKQINLILKVNISIYHKFICLD